MLIEIIGWTGSFLVVLAYALNLLRKISAQSLTYSLINIAGSAGMIINGYYHHAFPSIAVNVVWIAIAFFALLKYRKH